MSAVFKQIIESQGDSSEEAYAYLIDYITVHAHNGLTAKSEEIGNDKSDNTTKDEPCPLE